MTSRSLLTALLAACFASTLTLVAHADPAPFDLTGPTIDVRVTRGSATLPAAKVPSLAEGDRLWIKADLPDTQSENYLLVLAFLRGATNPPPASWFYPCRTWTDSCARDGMFVTVPKGAQQVLVFLAPETAGDFKTLVNAVRGRPGAFVRTSQDLNQATLDLARLQGYLAAVRSLDAANPERLQQAAPLLARSLAIRLDDKCMQRVPELQAPCLLQGRESLVLNDGHSTSIVQALTSGPASDLVMEASYTPQLSYGYYSPYIASILDIGRIFDSFRTARYVYIPALASFRGEHLDLSLNTPPSFHDPKSVMVAALPAIEAAQLPPLHAIDPKEVYCARKNSLVLPVEGAPLVFATGYAHDIQLTLTGKEGSVVSLPAHADPELGGFVVDTSGIGGTAVLGDDVHGSLRGRWGFDTYEGPTFALVNARDQAWSLGDGEDSSLIVGREGTIHLRAASVSCVDGIMVKDASGKMLTTVWKEVKPNEVEVRLPLQEAAPGSLSLFVTQYGGTQPQSVSLHAFADPGHLDGFAIHAGDANGILKGTRLDQVAGLTLQDAVFAPGTLTTSQGSDLLTLSTSDPQIATAFKPGETIKAKVAFKDGRVFTLRTQIGPARPSATLIGLDVQRRSDDARIQLADQKDVPLDARLTFSLRMQSPATFARDETIEIATNDESVSTTLSLKDGSITLENSQVAVVRLDPARTLGPSVFGPLRWRVVVNGIAGDWMPLATLVRLPTFSGLQCAASSQTACKLTGSDLFLVESISSDHEFNQATKVPDGFPGNSLPVPRTSDGRLYVKLRDDPAPINIAVLKVDSVSDGGTGAAPLPPPAPTS